MYTLFGKRTWVTWYSLSEPSLFGLCSIYLIWWDAQPKPNQTQKTDNIEHHAYFLNILQQQKQKNRRLANRTGQCMRTTLPCFFQLDTFFVCLQKMWENMNANANANVDVCGCCCLYFSCVHQKTFAIVDSVFGRVPHWKHKTVYILLFHTARTRMFRCNRFNSSPSINIAYAHLRYGIWEFCVHGQCLSSNFFEIPFVH